MPLQRIQIGTFPNDGSGDTLRSSFTKVNDNFLEVYNELGARANISNTINVIANRSTDVIFRHANVAFDKANAAYSYTTEVDTSIGYAYNNSNVAFNFANGTVANTIAAFRLANASFNTANTLSIQLNDSVVGLRARTNLIYNFANSIFQQINDTSTSDGLRLRTNLIYSFANNVHEKVNTNFTLTNVTFGRANSIYTHANEAFTKANSSYNYVDQISSGKLSNTGGISFAGSLYFPFGSRVGIGTNSPSSTLHIRSNSDNPLVILDSDSTQDLTLRFRRNGAYQWIINNENSTNDLLFSTPQISNLLRLTDEGNVGVGILPQYKLDVNGTSNFRAAASFSSFVSVSIPSAQLNTSGVYSFNPDGIGVRGTVTRSTGGTDGSIGVLGEARDGTGVKGVATTGAGTIGISTSQTGVYGQSQSGTGVHGQSLTNTTGVFGQTESGTGVYGQTQSGTGVHGRSLGSTTGVLGQSSSGTGVAAYSATGYGVHSTSGSNYSFVGGTDWSTSTFAVRASDGQIFNGSGLRPSYGIRAWVTFNGYNGTIFASQGVSSVVRNTKGDYTINFSSPMPDANYAVSGMGMEADGLNSGGSYQSAITLASSTSTTATSCRILNADIDQSDNNDGARITFMAVR